MSDGNQPPAAGETACPTYFAKRLIQLGGAGGFACRSNGHHQWSASKMNKFRKRLICTLCWTSDAAGAATASAARGLHRRDRSAAGSASRSFTTTRAASLSAI